MSPSRVLLSIFLLLVIAAVPFAAKSEELQARLPYTPNVAEGQILVFQNNRPRVLRAEVLHRTEGTLLRANVGEVFLGMKYAGVIFLADGRIISSPVLTAGQGDADAATNVSQIFELRAANEKLVERATQVAKEAEAANLELRRQAGLAEVDDILAKARDLDKKIEQLKSN